MSNEFRSEVELLAKIEHRNLVRLLGYVDRGNERLIITEYVPNGTLREHLDGISFINLVHGLQLSSYGKNVESNNFLFFFWQVDVEKS